ncbi:MAG: FKBP-type peptidyl-prolyl cis-trans isomerase [Alphaproteobacteria bacterium]|nr:FKBP-type peptidyl-prolyl cis-trans isomerase [Alphaproteobacteria bacterium]
MKGMKALLAAFVIAALGTPAAAANSALSPEANAKFLADNAHLPGVVTRPSGLQYKILHSGYGKRPQPTDIVTVYYTGSLINGQVFDGTEQGLPAQFPANKLIPGWTEALLLMREGDKWHIVIPANLAYGARGAGEGAIPPNQVLIFDLELVTVTTPKEEPKKPEDTSTGNQDL